VERVRGGVWTVVSAMVIHRMAWRAGDACLMAVMLLGPRCILPRGVRSGELLGLGGLTGLAKEKGLCVYGGGWGGGAMWTGHALHVFGSTCGVRHAAWSWGMRRGSVCIDTCSRHARKVFASVRMPLCQLVPPRVVYSKRAMFSSWCLRLFLLRRCCYRWQRGSPLELCAHGVVLVYIWRSQSAAPGSMVVWFLGCQAHLLFLPRRRVGAVAMGTRECFASAVAGFVGVGGFVDRPCSRSFV